jgi:hypothetical protein
MTRLIVKGIELQPPELETALASLTSFQCDFEKLFVSLAEQLPNLSTGIEKLSASLATVQGSKSGIRALVDERMKLMVTRQREATGRVLNEAHAGQSAASQVEQMASALATRLGQVQTTSLNLRLAGFNASFSAQGLGREGAAFLAVNGALIEVADGSASLAETIQATAHTLRDVSVKLGSEQQALAQEMSRSTEATETASRVALEACTQMLETLAQQLTEVTVSGGAVTYSTDRIMLAIQQQDILRQGLDHVILVLRALDTEFRAVSGSRSTAQVMAYLRFQEEAGRLSAELMGSLRTQLEELMGDVLQPLENLVASAGLIIERIGDPEQTEQSLSSPADRLVDGLTALPSLAAPLDACVGEVAQVSTEVSSLKPRLARLEQIPTHIRMVSVLMKIETARCEGLSRATLIAEDLTAASNTFRDLHLDATNAMTDFVVGLDRAQTALRRQRTSWDQLRSSPSLLADDAAGMHEVAKAFRGQLEELSTAARVLDQSASALNVHLTAFCTVVTATEAVRAACEVCRDEAARLTEHFVSLGCERAETPAALHSLIAQFTIFEHKQLATQATDLQTSASGGELTFF